MRFLPLMVWMALQWEAWARGHTSAIGRLLGLYCVYEDGQYSDHLQVASTAQVSIKMPFFGLMLLIGGTLPDPLPPHPCRLRFAPPLRRCFSARRCSSAAPSALC